MNLIFFLFISILRTLKYVTINECKSCDIKFSIIVYTYSDFSFTYQLNHITEIQEK